MLSFSFAISAAVAALCGAAVVGDDAGSALCGAVIIGGDAGSTRCGTAVVGDDAGSALCGAAVVVGAATGASGLGGGSCGDGIIHTSDRTHHSTSANAAAAITLAKLRSMAVLQSAPR